MLIDKKSARRGSGLMEVIVAGFVLSAALTVFLALIVPSNHAIARSRWRGVAARACYGQLERMRATKYSELSRRFSYGDATEQDTFAAPADLPGATGELSLRKVRVYGNAIETWSGGYGLPDGIEITARVSWADPSKEGGREQTSMVAVVVPRPQRLLGIL